MTWLTRKHYVRENIDSNEKADTEERGARIIG